MEQIKGLYIKYKEIANYLIFGVLSTVVNFVNDKYIPIINGIRKTVTKDTNVGKTKTGKYLFIFFSIYYSLLRHNRPAKTGGGAIMLYLFTFAFPTLDNKLFYIVPRLCSLCILKQSGSEIVFKGLTRKYGKVPWYCIYF